MLSEPYEDHCGISTERVSIFKLSFNKKLENIAAEEKRKKSAIYHQLFN